MECQPDLMCILLISQCYAFPYKLDPVTSPALNPHIPSQAKGLGILFTRNHRLITWKLFLSNEYPPLFKHNSFDCMLRHVWKCTLLLKKSVANY